VIHTTCDYCFRQFGYQAGEAAICLSCGLENIRPAVLEVAVSRSTPEAAVQSRPGTIRRKPRKQNTN